MMGQVMGKNKIAQPIVYNNSKLMSNHQVIDKSEKKPGRKHYRDNLYLQDSVADIFKVPEDEMAIKDDNYK